MNSPLEWKGIWFLQMTELIHCYKTTHQSQVTHLGRLLLWPHCNDFFKDQCQPSFFLPFFLLQIFETMPICYKTHGNMGGDEIFCSVDCSENLDLFLLKQTNKQTKQKHYPDPLECRVGQHETRGQQPPSLALTCCSIVWSSVVFLYFHYHYRELQI